MLEAIYLVTRVNTCKYLVTQGMNVLAVRSLVCSRPVRERAKSRIGSDSPVENHFVSRQRWEGKMELAAEPRRNLSMTLVIRSSEN